MDIGNVKDMIEELEKTALGFDDTRYGLLITASEMMTKLYQENERLRGLLKEVINFVDTLSVVLTQEETIKAWQPLRNCMTRHYFS